MRPSLHEHSALTSDFDGVKVVDIDHSDKHFLFKIMVSDGISER